MEADGCAVESACRAQLRVGFGDAAGRGGLVVRDGRPAERRGHDAGDGILARDDLPVAAARGRDRRRAALAENDRGGQVPERAGRIGDHSAGDGRSRLAGERHLRDGARRFLAGDTVHRDDRVKPRADGRDRAVRVVRGLGRRVAVKRRLRENRKQLVILAVAAQIDILPENVLRALDEIGENVVVGRVVIAGLVDVRGEVGHG